jgi:hypothetical protein
MSVVEFIGVPGAGKTTVSLIVAKQLGFEWHSLNVDGSNRRRQRMIGIASNPRLAWTMARQVRDGLGLSIMLHLLPRVRVQSSVVGNAVLDSASYFMAGAAVSRLELSPECLVRLLPTPDILVLLKVAPTLASERVRSRGRVARAADYDWDAVVKRTAKLGEALESVFLAAPCQKVLIEVDCHTKPSAVAESVVAAISEGSMIFPSEDPRGVGF